MRKRISAAPPFYLLLLTSLFTNCNNDTEPQSVLQLVSSAGQNYVSENRNVTGGKAVITGVYAQAPTENQSLTKFTVTFDHDSTDKSTDIVYLDSTLAPNTQTFAMQVAYTPRHLANKEIWKFTITDSEEKEYQRVIRLKTTSGNTNKSAFYTYTDVLLSRVKNPKTNRDSLGLIGFASAEGMAFPAYAVKQSGINSKMDLILNNDKSLKPSLSLASIKKADSLHLTTLTSTQFEDIKRVSDLKAAYPAVPGNTKAENLTVGQVLAYKSVKNKVGLLRIKMVHKTLDSLVFDVKGEK